MAITKRGKEKDEEKMAVGKEPTGGVQAIAPPRGSFLRRKVASPPRRSTFYTSPYPVGSFTAVIEGTVDVSEAATTV